MLAYFHIRNFALIDDLSLELSPGLNVLTGETGAGKSIVIGAISLLLGERASAEQVREGKEQALIEGVFNLRKVRALKEILSSAGLSGDELIISREIMRSGRNTCRVNGRIFPVTFLKELSQHLIDLHGQHQHQSLLRTESHLKMLDAFGEGDFPKRCAVVEELFKNHTALIKKLSSIGSDPRERARQLELLSYQIDEIERADLSEAEEKELLKRRHVLNNAERLYLITSNIYRELHGEEDSDISLIDTLQRASVELKKVSSDDQVLASPVNLLEEASAQLSEAVYELRDYIENIVFDPAELEKVEERLALFREIKRKYGNTIGEVLSFLGSARKEQDSLLNSEKVMESLIQKRLEIEECYDKAASVLTEARVETARRLESLLKKALAELALPGAKFVVEIKPESGYSIYGRDRVEFLFSANPGESAKPLAKIISGGEMSRVMLALKSIFACQDQIPTLIFDEIDSGIGGMTVKAVAEKLAGLGRVHQVICVTHSPQIASMAAHHIHLHKEVVEGRTLIRAIVLSPEEQRKEIARMLDGSRVNDLSLKHAASLLHKAEEHKG